MYRKDGGQVILVLLGAIALGLTIGLAIAGRSTVDVNLSRKLEDSARAFSAAEAGVEEILRSPLGTETTKQLTFSDSRATIQALPTPGPGSLYKFPDVLPAGEAQTVWFVNHDSVAPYSLQDAGADAYTGSTISVCWSGENPNTTPGLEVALTYRDATSVYRVVRRGFESGSTACPGGVNPNPDSNDCFAASISPVDCPDYKYQANISLNSTFGVDLTGLTKLFMRLRPYKDAVRIAVKTPNTASLPRQALVDAESIGESATGGETTRIRVFQGYPAPPAVFDYALFSGQGIATQ